MGFGIEANSIGLRCGVWGFLGLGLGPSVPRGWGVPWFWAVGVGVLGLGTLSSAGQRMQSDQDLYADSSERVFVAEQG